MELTRGEMLKLSLLGSAVLFLPLTRAAQNGEGEPLAVAREIPTSFGTVALIRAEKLPVFTAEQVALMTYGIREAAPPVKNVLVQTSVVLTNRLDRSIRYSEKQFDLIAGGSDRPIPLSGSTVRKGALPPDKGVTGTLSFVAPRDGSRLWFRFRDPAAVEPILIDLGRTDAFDGADNRARTKPGAQGGHH